MTDTSQHFLFLAWDMPVTTVEDFGGMLEEGQLVGVITEVDLGLVGLVFSWFNWVRLY